MKKCLVWLPILLSQMSFSAPYDSNDFPYSELSKVLSFEEFDHIYGQQILNDSNNLKNPKKIYHLLPEVEFGVNNAKIIFDKDKINIIKKIDELTKEFVNEVYQLELNEFSSIISKSIDISYDALDLEEQILLYQWKSQTVELLETLGYSVSIYDEFSRYIDILNELKSQTQAIVEIDVEKKHSVKTLKIVEKVNNSLNIELTPYLKEYKTKLWNKGVIENIWDDTEVVTFYNDYNNSFYKSGKLQVGLNFNGLGYLSNQGANEKLFLPMVLNHELESVVEADLEMNCKIDQDYIRRLEASAHKLPNGGVDVSVLPAAIDISSSNNARSCKILNNSVSYPTKILASHFEEEFKKEFTSQLHMTESFRNQVIENISKEQAKLEDLPLIFHSEYKYFNVSRDECWTEHHSRRYCKNSIFGKCINHGTHRWSTKKCRTVTDRVRRLVRTPKKTLYTYIADVKIKLGLEKKYKINGSSIIKFDINSEKMLNLGEFNRYEF